MAAHGRGISPRLCQIATASHENHRPACAACWHAQCSTYTIMKKRKLTNKTSKVGSRLRGIVDAVLRRFKGVSGELEAKEDQPASDPIAEAGQESFPASDPPSFTPEKST